MNKINWSVILVVGIILLILLFSTGLFGGWGYRGGGMMGPGMMGHWGFAPLGWVGMIFMWLVPIGFIVLAVLGIVWLVRNLGGNTPPAVERTCPNCGKGVQADWQHCPHCGTALK
ncbi:MAG TPA: zinc ribbon domain-containing protein [Anaerolineales bacterium]|nr:zinc ribbon domain-containing protein [Anaerolineales bacterium]